MDNQGIRRAIQNFVIQPDMIMAVMGNLTDGQVCGALMMCGSSTGSEVGTELLLSKDPIEVRLKRGMEMMRAAGYKNEPIVILDATDQVMQHNEPPRVCRRHHSLRGCPDGQAQEDPTQIFAGGA